jgi:hypothetical protein
VFRLPKDVKGRDGIMETILRSEPIYPQPEARGDDIAKCATCGLVWDDIMPPFLILKDDTQKAE